MVMGKIKVKVKMKAKDEDEQVFFLVVTSHNYSGPHVGGAPTAVKP